MKGCFFTICSAVCLATFGAYVVLGIQFNINCKGHLKRAADSNTVEMAKKELDIAIEYLEKEGLTEGYTSVIYKTPDEDIEFWYSNLKSASQELAELPNDAPALEKSNALMKLRETIMDQGEKGERVTAPAGISRYPYNGLLGTLMALSMTFIFVAYISINKTMRF